MPKCNQCGDLCCDGQEAEIAKLRAEVEAVKEESILRGQARERWRERAEEALLQVDLATERETLANAQIERLLAALEEEKIVSEARKRMADNWAKKCDDTLLQVRDLTEILEAAEGMFTHGSALNGTHATILRMKIEGYRGRQSVKPKCAVLIGDGSECGYATPCPIKGHSEKRKCDEVHPGQDIYHPEGH